MASRSSISPSPAQSNIAGRATVQQQRKSVKLNVSKRPPLSSSALFSLVLTIRETGRRLGMSDPAIATSCTLFHRMLRVLTTGDEAATPSADADLVSTQVNSLNTDAIEASIRTSLGQIDPYTMAMACISLGAKVQEEHQRLRDVIVAYYRVLHKSRRPALEVGEDYDRLRQSLVNSELLLMRLLEYQVRKPNLPHAHLLHYMSALMHWIGKGIAQPPGSDLSAGTEAGAPVPPLSQSALALARLPGLAWSILADSYHTSLCLDFAPDHIAAAILHLALRIAGVEVTGNRHSEVAWWQAISDTLSREIVEQIQLKVMDIYSIDDRVNSFNSYKSNDFEDY